MRFRNYILSSFLTFSFISVANAVDENNCNGNVLKHLDFDEGSETETIHQNFGTHRPIVYYKYKPASGTYSKNLREFNDCTSALESTTFTPTNGGGILSQTPLVSYGSGGDKVGYLKTLWGGNRFLRFYSLKSNAVKDRAELALYGSSVTGGLVNGGDYSLGFNLKLPPENYKNYYIFPHQTDWFIITQIKQLSTPNLVPILSINLVDYGYKKSIQVVRRGYNHYNGYSYTGNAAADQATLDTFVSSSNPNGKPVLNWEVLATFDLDNVGVPSFTFNQWKRFRVDFTLGSNSGGATLYVETSPGSGNMIAVSDEVNDQTGAVNIGHAISQSQSSIGLDKGAWVKMGLYRGTTGSRMRDGYIVDYDNIILKKHN